jgi:hypothetical protein
VDLGESAERAALRELSGELGPSLGEEHVLAHQPEVPCSTPTGVPEAPTLSVPLVGTYVFSPTAAIIYRLREAALEGRVTRVFHFDQPRFAWK